MRQKVRPQKAPAEQAIKDIRRATHKHHGAEDKIRLVLGGSRGEESIAAFCRRKGIGERNVAGSRQGWEATTTAAKMTQ